MKQANWRLVTNLYLSGLTTYSFLFSLAFLYCLFRFSKYQTVMHKTTLELILG